jgi:ubiquinone/menaquinone biosynthesis C-methylase UbiE
MSVESSSADRTAAQAYERFLLPFLFQPWAERAAQWAAPTQGEHVLDVACGTGVGARMVARAIGASGKVVGLDVDAGMLATAQERMRDVDVPTEWHCGNALEMPFADASFDLCLCLQGLQFFPDRGKGLTEMRRVLKPSGRLVVTVWSSVERNPGNSAVYRAMEMQGIDTTSPRRGFSLNDSEELRQLTKMAGFRFVEVREEEKIAAFPSTRHFVEGMVTGAPYTRRALEGLTEIARAQCIEDATQMLKSYERQGTLELPLRVNVMHAVR